MSFNFFTKKEDVKSKSDLMENYVIIRSKSAGVFAGTLVSMKEQCCILENARRLWYWVGSSSLSEMAVKGVSKPEECKFPCQVPEILINEVIECIPCTKTSFESIKSVKEWSSH